MNCPDCGGEMVVRVQRENPRSRFYGCLRWPDCTGTMPIPEDQKLRAMGAATLPGFDQ